MAIRRVVLLLALVLLVGAFSSITAHSAIATFQQTTDVHGDPAYLSSVNFQPDDAQFYDLVNTQLAISEEEYDNLAQNGFVVTDRHNFPTFVEGYAWIYWRDLPVLITTDS